MCDVSLRRVLDTCTGLGYTAIAAARCKGVTGVVTVELDEVSLRMCARNPWSREMFDSDKVTSLQGDCCEASEIEVGILAPSLCIDRRG